MKNPSSDIMPETLPKRFVFLDQVRGSLLLSMIIYHIFWDLVWIFSVPIPWFHSWGAVLWQQGTAGLFILLSGFCWKLGRKPLQRGLFLLTAGGFLTIGSLFFSPILPIYFGILTLLGSAMILTIPAEKLLDLVSPLYGAGVSLLLFFFTREIGRGFLGWSQNKILLPKEFYQNFFTAYLGFPPSSFVSADYFPLIPWLFLFWTGIFLYRFWRQSSRALPKNHFSFDPIGFLGRHSLGVYLLHQPLINSLLLGVERWSSFFEAS